MALSRIEHAYLAGEIPELPERYFVMLNRWLQIEHTLGWERVPQDVTPRDVTPLHKLRAAFRLAPKQEPHNPQDGTESERETEGRGVGRLVYDARDPNDNPRGGREHG